MDDELRSEDLIQNGIRAAQEGDRASAKLYLSKAVLSAPNSEDAWWWLGQSVDDPQQRAYCFQRVLAINPGHEGAKAQLADPTPTPPFLEDDEPIEDPDLSSAQPDAAVWSKPEMQSTRRSSSQQVVIIMLVLALLCIVVAGGAYIFLDSTGYFSGQPLTATTTSPQKPTATDVIIVGTQVLPPTWTPTPSLTPQATRTPLPDTPIPTEELSPTPTIQPPTPAATPASGSAIAADLAGGTGSFYLGPDQTIVYRFTSEYPLELETVVVLTNHLVGFDQAASPQVVLYLWDLETDDWDARVPSWGNNSILSPNNFVTQDGTILAALWNWSDSEVDILEFGFTIGGKFTDGTNLFYGLSEPEPRFLLDPTPVPTMPFADG
ncbi:MAG: tetratricopeptide repeat protein [Anaerolineales bacterium]